MKIHVGSKNETKLAAVWECLKNYPAFSGADIVAQEVSVEEFGHPKTLKETVDGAIARAKAAYEGADLSIGLEGGLMAVPETKTGYMEISVCAIYDGKDIHLGLSSGYEWPQEVTNLILQGMDGSQALKQAGITDHPKIGTAQGGIWFLTDGQMTRKDLLKQSLVSALIHLQHPEWY